MVRAHSQPAGVERGEMNENMSANLRRRAEGVGGG